MHAGLIGCDADAPVATVAWLLADGKIHSVVVHLAEGSAGAVADRKGPATQAARRAPWWVVDRQPGHVPVRARRLHGQELRVDARHLPQPSSSKRASTPAP